MPFNRPTLQTLVSRAMADLNGRLTDGDARLPVSVLNVLAYINGGAADGLYGYLDWLADQLMIDKCEEEYLLRWAGIWKVKQKGANPAQGIVVFTGNNGKQIDAGTLIQRVDAVQYQTCAPAVIAGGSARVAVVAVLGGLAGNTTEGTQLKLVSPIPDVDSTVTVAIGGLTDGTDIETPDELRGRLLNRIQDPPQGGTASDYVKWALEVPGVTRAWVYPGEMGAGTVTIRFVRDNDPGGIIPDAAAVAAVKAHIELKRSVTATVYVVAPVASPVDFQIRALDPNTPAVRTAVVAELADLLRREAIPNGTILLSHIRAAISAAVGENDHELASPVANVTNTIGRISTMGAVSWL